MRRRKSSILVYFLTIAFLLYFFPKIISAIGDPIKISTSTNATTFPQLVADSKGYLHMVWMEVTSDAVRWGGTTHANPGILYSRWNGDNWSAPLKISENTGFAEIPSIAVDSNDNVYATWDDETYGSGGRVAYTTRTPGSAGTWSAIETLPLPTGGIFGWNSRVALDAANTPHVVFSSAVPGSGDSIYWTQKVSGAWTAPELVSKNSSDTNLTDCQWPWLKQENDGTVHLVYWCWSAGIWYRSFSSGTWSTPFQISSAGNIEYVTLAVTPAGEVFVTWFEVHDTSVRVLWTQGGVWQAETTLTNSATRSSWFFPIMGVTTDSKERAHVGWGEKDAGNLIDLRYRTYASATWGPVRDVDLDNNDADTPFVFPDLWDNQHFAWTEKNPVSNQWEIMYRVAEGTIQTVGTGGGTITADPGNTTYVTLDIPSSALSANTEIGIQIGPVPEIVDPTQVTIPRAFTFRPHGLVFEGGSVATAQIFYFADEVVGVDERQLKAWLWNSQTNSWEAKATKVFTGPNRIDVDLSGFSLYGISAPIVNTVFATPTQNETIKQAALLFEFTLGYADGSEFVEPETADELTVKVKKVKNEEGELVKSLSFEPSGITLDKGKKRYKGTLLLQKEGFQKGEYTLEVYLADSLVGTQTFILE